LFLILSPSASFISLDWHWHLKAFKTDFSFACKRDEHFSDDTKTWEKYHSKVFFLAFFCHAKL